MALTLSATAASAANGPGVSDDEVLICSYQPMTGKISSYFRMGKGADAWFKHVNDNGGVHGRPQPHHPGHPVSGRQGERHGKIVFRGSGAST